MPERFACASSIFKDDSDDEPGHHRPISMLLTEPELVECIVHTQLTEYLNRSHVISES